MSETNRILVVEDEVLIAYDIKDTLSQAGLGEVEVAANLRSALAALAARKFDLAVLDGNLNGDSAEPVAEALSAGGIPFLVVSGYSTAQRGGALASAAFLGKPFTPEALVHAAQSAMRKP